MAKNREIVIKDTHRGLWYEDGVLIKMLSAGRYQLPRQGRFRLRRRPSVQLVLVDVRERDLTVKGQEILTCDKVTVRVSIVIRFRVIDPQAAMHEVEDYHSRLYSDVQMAARQALASMSLEEVLGNRSRLGEDILRDIREGAGHYGLTILRADVKDLVFPGSLQEIMNRVLAAERLAQAQLVEARAKADIQRIDAQAGAEAERLASEARAIAQRLEAENEARVRKIRTQAEIESLHQREEAATAYALHPALLRLEELETLRTLAGTANTKVYVNFERERLGEGDP